MKITVQGWPGEYEAHRVLDYWELTTGERVARERGTPVARVPVFPEDWGKEAWFRDRVGEAWRKGRVHGHAPQGGIPWFDSRAYRWNQCLICDVEPPR